ncbi:MAG: (Fe-S)-binding protein [Bradyrhizobium sp.]
MPGLSGTRRAQAPLRDFLAAEAQSIANACTKCGTCVEICPVVPYTAAAGAPAGSVAGGIIDFLANTSELGAASDAWASACNGCGLCIPACPEGVNPRKMLVLAGSKAATVHSKTPELFRQMSRTIKIMLAMQLVPEEFRRLFTPPAPRSAPVVFYVGCNALRTPHLLFNSMAVLDALEVDYEVIGGPSSCCGVIATKWEGRTDNGERITSNTIDRFEGFRPEKVLNWCPTCQLHLGETLHGYRERTFEFDHLTKYLAGRIDDLREKFRTPIRKRAVVHAHVGRADVCRDVDTLLHAIPGLDIVETVFESGYTCGGSGCSKAPELAAREHAELVARVEATGADVLVTLYHGCHATFAGMEARGQFRVLNFTDLLVQALGTIPHDDRLKQFRLLGDWQMIVDDARPYLLANGLDIDLDWLKRHGPAIFASLEFKGQLDCFEAPARHAAHRGGANADAG